MEKLTSIDSVAQFDRDRSVIDGIGSARVLQLRDMMRTAVSPRALALVAALCGAGALETQTAQAETVPGSFSSSEVRKEATKLFSDTLRGAHSHAEFTTALTEELSTKSDDEKLAVLSILGAALGREYDYDMLQENEHIALADSEIFTALKSNQSTVGICGNIHEYIKQVASSIGLESFTASGTLSLGDGGYGGHVYSMVRADVLQADGSTKQELVIVNYNSVVPTGTDKLDEAMGMYEQRFGTPSFFAQTISLPNGDMVPISTPASETLTELAHMGNSAREKLTDEANRPEGRELGFTVNGHLGTKDITFTGPTMSISFGQYANQGDPFNSIASADSLTLGYRTPQSDPDVAHTSTEFKFNLTQADLLKPQSDAVVFASSEFSIGYHSNKNELMTSETFGKISGQFEAMARVGLALTMQGNKHIPLAGLAPSGEADVALEYNVYFDLNDATTLYATVGLSGQMVLRDFETQKPTLQAGQYYELGIDTERVDASVSYATDGVRSETAADLSLLAGETTFSMNYEISSDFPGDSSETFGIGASKNIGKNGRLTINGYDTDGDRGASIEFVTEF